MDKKYDLPPGWKWVKLGEVCEVFSGSSAPQDDKYFRNGMYPFVRVSDLGNFGRTTSLVEIRDKINDLCLKELNMVKARKRNSCFSKKWRCNYYKQQGYFGYRCIYSFSFGSSKSQSTLF